MLWQDDSIRVYIDLLPDGTNSTFVQRGEKRSVRTAEIPEIVSILKQELANEENASQVVRVVAFSSYIRTLELTADETAPYIVSDYIKSEKPVLCIAS